MKVILLWRSKKGVPQDVVEVGKSLGKRFAPLFDEQPAIVTREFSGAHLALLDIPLDGWNADTEQEDPARWVMAIDPPINARAALKKAGIESTPANRLLTLATALETDPRPVLRELAPNSSILWEHKATRTAYLQTDGLGHSQLFEYEDDDFYVLTNRVQSLSVLGISLDPVADEWAARFTMGWFPLSTTGFRGVRTLHGGTQIKITTHGISRTVHNVLREWVHPEPMSREEALELGANSLVEMCDEAISQWDRPSVGLSGGFDSRAIMSILRHRGADVDMRVRGHPERLDVLIANHLAELADIPLRIKPHGGMPPETVEDVRWSIGRALLWQGGGIHLKKHLSFRVRGGFARGGVNVMGSHAGIGKADFAVTIGADKLDEAQWEEALLAHFTANRPVSLEKSLHEPVRQHILASVREAERYELTGLHKLHFLFLHEYTRRWAAGAINGAADLVFTPFLNPDFIRAAYAFPADELPGKPFHRHVVAKYAPDWAEVPYDSDITRDDKHLFKPVRLSKSKKAFVESGTERWRPGEGGHRLFHRKFFWRDVGKGLINEANKAEDSFTHEVFDQETMRPLYKKCPDAIAVAHLLPAVIEGKALRRLQRERQDAPPSTSASVEPTQRLETKNGSEPSRFSENRVPKKSGHEDP